MRFVLRLQTARLSLLPFNYQYPLSAAIYKIIQRADAGFAAFLHNTGYGEGHKSFKLFVFSDVGMKLMRRGDKMQLIENKNPLINYFFKLQHQKKMPPINDEGSVNDFSTEKSLL